MRIAVGCDHAGFPLKQTVIDELTLLGQEVVDEGTNSTASVDYPDYAAKVARTIQQKQADRGILICGSGVGACIAANKFKGISACLCHDTYSARQGVEHDDMNVLCIGGRIVGAEVAKELVRAFLSGEFSTEERHRRRVGKTRSFEENWKNGGMA